MATAEETKTRRIRRPKPVLLQDKIEEADKKIAYHEKHLATAQQEKEDAIKALEHWQETQGKEAETRIAKLEAELEALRRLKK